MRVALLSSLRGGGPVVHALAVAERLHELGHLVTAVCGDPDVANEFEQRGARAAVVPATSWLDVNTVFRIRKHLREVDVAHTHDRRMALLTHPTPRPAREIIRVHTAHGIADPYLPEPIGTTHHRARHRLAYELVEPAVARRCDAVVVPSRAVAADLVARLRWSKQNLHVIPNGVRVGSPRAFRPIQTVGTVSRLDPFKGLDVFLRAVALVRRGLPDVRFHVFGSGDANHSLRTLASELGVGDIVHFPGHVPSKDALARLDAFVLSSYWENAPIALLEAMAFGVPVVATSVAGVPEIVDATSGDLVAPGDPTSLAAAIAKLVREPERAERQAAAAADRIRRDFSLEASVDSLVSLYAAQLAARAGGAGSVQLFGGLRRRPQG